MPIGNNTSGHIFDTTFNSKGVLYSDSSGVINSTTSVNSAVLATDGSGNPSLSTTPTVSSITISNAPSAGTDGTNKTYVDNAIAAVNPATSVLAASTGAFTVNYFNGVSGVGATLTNAGTQAAFAIDGQSPIIGQRVLIKDQSSTFQNGVYTVTIVGTGATNWILTRALDYDQPSDINNTGVINVLNGTVNALTGWLINSSVTNVGADAITYTKYNNAPVTTTQYAVLVGAASNGIGSVGPGSAGQALLSGGAAANPVYSTATYPSTATSTGTILRADGTNWVASTPTFPNAASTALKHIKSDGTNFVTTTVTYPDASVTAGKVIVSDGTNYIASTPTFPNASATSGKIIISDGTNWIASIPTYPNTSGTAGKVVISDGTNNVYSTPTFPNASATSGKIIKSDGTNWVASTETYAAPGASGNVLKSDGTNWTSAAGTGVGLIKTVTVPLTNAQIKALNSSAVTILAAQGVGVVTVVLSVILKLVYGGTNAFTGSGNTNFCYGTTVATNAIFPNIVNTSFWTNTATTYYYGTGTAPTTGLAASIAENAIISLSSTAAIAGNAANDNTGQVELTYYTIAI